MSLETARIKTLIAGLQLRYPKIYEAINAIADDLSELDTSVAKVQSAIAISGGGLAIAPNVTVFQYSFTRKNVKLTWERPDFSIFQYEIRLGTVWETANHVLTTSTLSAVFDPLLVGTTSYLIKGIDFDGNYSVSALRLDVIVPSIGNISVSSQVIDNNVLLSWAEPTTTFDIAYYEVRRASTLIGSIKSTFTVIFETAGGTLTYKVRSVDIAGNIGPEAIIEVVVRKPADYNLLASGIDDLTGTKVNTIIDNGRLLCNLNTTETWQQHFDNNSWADPQAQVNAGYPIYIQPAPLTGTYEKVFDFGSIITNAIISLAWEENQISGSTNATSEIATSTDGVGYTSFVSGRTLFSASFRYVKVKMTFTGATNLALVEFYGLTVSVDVKTETDSGQVNANDTDIGGTTVNFNKVFKDVDSITLTVDTLEPITPIYDFNDIPNPTNFKVLVFDNVGHRVDYLVSWKARGII